MMKTNTPLETLFDEARGHEAFGEPNPFGFETRLQSAIAESGLSGIEVMGRLSWQFTIVCLPLLLTASLLLGFQNSGFLPEGLGGVVSQWSLLIPVDIF
ncbi:MAG: hypothetical protein P1U58_02230 [Verrucomicrobiales bacterium]|nr:hypothetical protein [Verrucomicrobiales bacterium]